MWVTQLVEESAVGGRLETSPAHESARQPPPPCCPAASRTLSRASARREARHHPQAAEPPAIGASSSPMGAMTLSGFAPVLPEVAAHISSPTTADAAADATTPSPPKASRCGQRRGSGGAVDRWLVRSVS